MVWVPGRTIDQVDRFVADLWDKLAEPLTGEPLTTAGRLRYVVPAA
jgi:hypothetical protein